MFFPAKKNFLCKNATKSNLPLAIIIIEFNHGLVYIFACEWFECSINARMCGVLFAHFQILSQEIEPILAFGISGGIKNKYYKKSAINDLFDQSRACFCAIKLTEIALIRK